MYRCVSFQQLCYPGTHVSRHRARGATTSHDTTLYNPNIPWNDVYQDFPRRRRPHHNTLEHCTTSPTIEHHHTDKGIRSRMITRPKKKTRVLRRSNLVFFLSSWQRRAGSRWTRVRSARSSLVEWSGGHRCGPRARPMTPRPARPAHFLAACWMRPAAVALEALAGLDVRRALGADDYDLTIV